jgi:hypothetical protein
MIDEDCCGYPAETWVTKHWPASWLLKTGAR